MHSARFGLEPSDRSVRADVFVGEEPDEDEDEPDEDDSKQEDNGDCLLGVTVCPAFRR
jgi:hypothetical protein